MDEETQVTAAASEEGSAGETESPVAMSGLESLKDKTENVTLETENNETNENTDEEKPVKPAKEGDEKPEVKIDPDFQAYLDEKELDLGDLASNEKVQSLVNNLRDAEEGKARAENQSQLEQTAMARRQAQATVDKALEAGETEVIKLSPVKQAEDNYINSVQGLMDALGYEKFVDFKAEHPKLLSGLEQTYAAAKDSALSEETQWHLQQRDEQAARDKAVADIEKESEQVQRKADDLISEAKKDYPTIAEDFEAFGVSEFVDSFAEITGVPAHYFAANQKFFDFISKASAAMKTVQDIPNIEGKLKSGMEKAIKNTKQAETVSSDDLLPDDHKAVANIDFKSSFNSIGRGVRI